MILATKAQFRECLQISIGVVLWLGTLVSLVVAMILGASPLNMLGGGLKGA